MAFRKIPAIGSSDGQTVVFTKRFMVGGLVEYVGVFVQMLVNACWEEHKLLSAPANCGINNSYAFDLSSDGNTILIGVENAKAGPLKKAGQVYVFSRVNTTWVQQTVITDSDDSAGGWFGISVSLSADGHTALIGAGSKDVGDTFNAGAAYVFTRTNAVWQQQAILTARDRASFDCFGWMVNLSGDGRTAIVGAHNKKIENAKQVGGAYIFTQSEGAWAEQAILTSGDTTQAYWFGYSASLSEDGHTALVGAYNEVTRRGEAYVFIRVEQAWIKYAYLDPCDSIVEDYFSGNVRLSASGTMAVIGTYSEATCVALVHVYTRSNGTWSECATLNPRDSVSSCYLGRSVRLSGNGQATSLGENWTTLDDLLQAGQAYIFS